MQVPGAASGVAGCLGVSPGGLAVGKPCLGRGAVGQSERTKEGNPPRCQVWGDWGPVPDWAPHLPKGVLPVIERVCVDGYSVVYRCMDVWMYPCRRDIEYTIYNIHKNKNIYIYVMYQEVPSHTEAIYNCQGPVGPDPAALVFAASFCWPAPPLIFFFLHLFLSSLLPPLPLSSSSPSHFHFILICISIIIIYTHIQSSMAVLSR